MLKAKKLPDQFRGDVVTRVVYLLNRASTKNVQGIAPQEAWSGLNPTVSHLKVFGCINPCSKNDWKVHEMVVKSVFLNGYLEDEIYVEQPPSYANKIEEENKMCRLKKALYGLKQAPRAWCSCINNFFLKEGFRRYPYEHALYTKEDENDNFLTMWLYVDDLIFTGNSSMMIEEFKESIKKEFKMIDIGLLHYFLGTEVKQGDNEIAISQKKYAKDLLIKFKMENAYPASIAMELGLKLSKHDASEPFDATIYKSLVGSLVYLTTTRPNLMFSVNLFRRFMASPKRSQWEAGKRVLRYIL
ncbi:putative mitochondrial protein [Cucumis melo var. makuwa]|uniref:Mitochondrial protein n=1 Tax=Cucumis melo var. makuwa TaxID=1194695 RepID=A0A5A7UI97_CUCMM|nr:putative mitochondrial protein [Cucumis melo var. makuwa]